MKALRKMQSRKGSEGFTLVELLVVVLVLGIIAAIVIPAFTSSGSAAARGQALITFATQGQGIVRSTISQMQLPYVIEGSANNNNMIEATDCGNLSPCNWLAVLAYGDESPDGTVSIIKNNFRGRYGITGAGTLREAMDLLPGSGPNDFDFRVQGYPITLTQDPEDSGGNALGAALGDARTWAFNFAAVPEDVVLAIVTKLVDSNTAQVNPAGDLANPVVRYSAQRADGQYDLSIIRTMR